MVRKRVKKKVLSVRHDNDDEKEEERTIHYKKKTHKLVPSTESNQN